MMEMEAVELYITVVLFIIVFVFTCLSLFILFAVTESVIFYGGKEKGRELWQNVLLTQGIKETFCNRSSAGY